MSRLSEEDLRNYDEDLLRTDLTTDDLARIAIRFRLGIDTLEADLAKAQGQALDIAIGMGAWQETCAELEAELAGERAQVTKLREALEHPLFYDGAYWCGACHSSTSGDMVEPVTAKDIGHRRSCGLAAPDTKEE